MQRFDGCGPEGGEVVVVVWYHCVVRVLLVLWEIVGGRSDSDLLSQLLPMCSCFDLEDFSLEDRTSPYAEISNDCVCVSDIHVGKVLRCWVKDGAFLSALVGMVGVIPADLAIH